MDIKFDKDSNSSQQGAGDGKGKQNALLVVLLLLVGAFAYIYFFTGLIKPAEDKKPAEGAPAAAQAVKKPLPPADGAAAKPDAAAEAKKDAAAPPAKPEAAPAPVPAPAPAAAAKPADDVQAAVKKPLPAAQPAAKPAAPAPAKPAAPAPAAKPAPAPAAKPAAPAEKKVAAAPEVKQPPQPAKAPEKKETTAKAPAAKPAAAPAAQKKEAPKAVKKEATAPAAKTGTGDWTVLVGNYVLEEALAVDLAKVGKAGFQANVAAASPKKTHMNRLLLAEFTDREAAQAELAKLKKFTSDAFMIDRAGMHAVYAGSYLLDARAISEKERLGSAGFKLTLTRVDVSIPTKNLTVGSFADKAAAEDVLKKLKAANVKATLIRK